MISPEKIYTLAEAAEILRLTNRGVAKIARRHGLCMIAGRKILLSESDIEGVKDALRAEPSMPTRTGFVGALHGERLFGVVSGLSGKASASPKLRELAIRRSGRPSAKKILKEEFGE